MGWTNSPQYLKHLQKIRAMNPEKRAVTQSLIDELSGIYAGRDMQRQLEAMKVAAATKSEERNLDLGKQRLDLRKTVHDNRHDLAKRDYRQNERSNQEAENIGWAGIPVAGLTGYGEYKHKQKLTNMYNKIAKTY